jgi:hypothetical protein
MSGVDMVIKQALRGAGIDLVKVQADFTNLKDGVTNTLKAIEEKFVAIQSQLDRIEAAQWQMNPDERQLELTLQPQPQNQQPQPKH